MNAVLDTRQTATAEPNSYQRIRRGQTASEDIEATGWVDTVVRAIGAGMIAAGSTLRGVISGKTRADDAKPVRSSARAEHLGSGMAPGPLMHSPEVAEPRASEMIQGMRQYLDSVTGSPDESKIPARLASDAWRAWLALWGQMDGMLPVPSACTTGDGRLIYVWQSNEHHLELEFYNDQPAEFFYQNRHTGELWGEDYQVGQPLPPGLSERLSHFRIY